MTYTYIKLERTLPNGKIIKYDDWRLLVDSSSTLLEYHRKIGSSIDSKRLKDIMTGTLDKNLSNNYKSYASAHKISIIDAVGDLRTRAIQSQLKYIYEGRKIIFNDVGGYMLLEDDDVIVDKIVMKNMAKPDFSEKDIKISRFTEGQHYYAKIGFLDVIDEYENVKWNTHKEAMNAAKTFLKNLM